MNENEKDLFIGYLNDLIKELFPTNLVEFSGEKGKSMDVGFYSLLRFNYAQFLRWLEMENKGAEKNLNDQLLISIPYLKLGSSIKLHNVSNRLDTTKQRYFLAFLVSKEDPTGFNKLVMILSSCLFSAAADAERGVAGVERIVGSLDFHKMLQREEGRRLVTFTVGLLLKKLNTPVLSSECFEMTVFLINKILICME